jgi:histone H3/H4
MPGVKSAPIERITESVNDNLGQFTAEKLVPDVEGLLENLPALFSDAFTNALKAAADRMDSDMPVHSDVTEALREMVPVFANLAERATEAYEKFKTVHAEDLKRYHEPRTNEPAANV